MNQNEATNQEQVETLEVESQPTAQALVDLDKLDKFVYQGKEMTPEELHSAILRQQDYSKKTQVIAKERKFYSEEMPKYLENLPYDLETIKANPGLADQFRNTYPPQFHSMVDKILELSTNNRVDVAAADDVLDEPSAKQLKALQRQIATLEKKLGRVDQLEQGLQEKELAHWDKHAETLYSNFSQQYPLASEDWVTTQALIAKGKGMAITDGLLEKLFRKDHEARESIAEKRHKERIKEKLKKSSSAKDMGSGSDVPQVTKKRVTISEAAENAIRRIQGLNR